MRRRIIRERVLQALYAHEISHDSLEWVIGTIIKDLEKNQKAHAFAKQLIVESVAHQKESDKIIHAHLTTWDMRRTSLIDKLILRMAICELLHFSDIPPKTSMNEAIELAKLFGSEESAMFVNGILDAIYADLMLTGVMRKSGRGLIGYETRRVGSRPMHTPKR